MTTVVVGATVLCGTCSGMMRPCVYRNLVGEQLDWLFWRCTSDPDHITPALPMPGTMQRG